MWPAGDRPTAEGDAMGAKLLRVAGAACLTVGAVLLVSGSAWSTQNGFEVPGGVVDDALAVPGTVLAHPAHDDPGASGEDATAHEESAGPEAERASAGDPDAQGASENRDAYITRTCERILGRPPTGGLDKTTDPPAGSSVAAGDDIDVT